MARFTYPRQLARGWDPFHDLGRLQEELDQLFEVTGLGRPFLAQRERRFPLVNVVTDERQSVLSAELPGVELRDLDITLTGNTLTLKGERKAETEVPEEKYYRRERGAGPFGRSVELPHKVDTDCVQASLENGVLKVVLPKAPEVQPRRIEVKV
jgi:HSP20 family protein